MILSSHCRGHVPEAHGVRGLLLPETSAFVDRGWVVQGFRVYRVLGSGIRV